MRDLQARDLFHALIGADTLPVRKPDPAPFFEAVKRAGGDVSRSCMIGDTLTDHSTAKLTVWPIVRGARRGFVGPVHQHPCRFRPAGMRM